MSGKLGWAIGIEYNAAYGIVSFVDN